MSGHRQKKVKRNKASNITGVILRCQFGRAAGPVMPSWKKRKIRLEMVVGRVGKQKN
jgi:hypothetical protein